MLSEVWNAPVLTMAVGKKRVTGAGAELFAACDLRVALEDSTFAFPGSAFGLVLGTRRLGVRVGAEVAIALALSGAYIDAQRARTLGLVSKIITAPDIPRDCTEAQELVRKHTPHTVAAIKGAALSSYKEEAKRDMEALVESGSMTGLNERIVRYRPKVMGNRRELARHSPSG